MRTSWRDGLVRGLFATLALWPLLAFLLYSVFIRIHSKYLAALLSASGLDGDMAVVNRAFLYRNDVLLVGMLAPLALTATLMLLRRRAALLIWWGVILASLTLLYANLQSWGQVGRFLNWQALVNAVAFGLSKPEFIGEYLSFDGLTKLAVLILASTGLLAAACKLNQSSLLLRSGAVLGLVGMVCSGAAGAFGYTSAMKRVPITGSFLANAVQALAFGEQHAPARLAPEDLGTQFERLSGGPLDDYRGPNFGVAAGQNLLLFVMETGSIEFLDVRKELPVHPVLARLRPHLFLAKNHFSTFPASAESNLSLLTGMYPPRALYDTCLIGASVQQGRRVALPGVIPALREQGYATGLYAPFRSQVPADKVVFEMTGFERVFYGQDNNPKADGGADNRTLKELVKDVGDWSRSGRRFAVAYFPQVGHGPWSADLGPTIRERGQRLAMLQLQWLEQLVDQIDKAGQLENTVIVLTGDHGVRTSLEDPRVRVGMVDQYSFHVPLLMYAPKADYTGLDPNAPSSHVDLAAELSQLFGVARTAAMQGLAFHHPKQGTRRQFLISNWYYGADGYREAGEAAMYSIMLDTVYLRSDGSVDFGSANVVRDKSVARRVSTSIGQMLDLQEAWIEHRACNLLRPLKG